MGSLSPKNRLLSHFLLENAESASATLINFSPENLAKLFNSLPVESLMGSLKLLPVSILAESFALVEHSVSLAFMNRLSPEMLAGIFRQWASGSEEVQARSSRLLENLEPAQGAALKTLLSHAVGTIGSLMNPVPLSVRPQLTVKEVLALLREKKNRYSRYIYIVDENLVLKGSLPFREVFYADENAVVSQLMTSKVFSLNSEQSAKDVFKDSSWRRWDSIPVTDSKKKLLGVIRYEALEKYFSEPVEMQAEEDGIYEAGAAVGELFQIAVSAAISVIGIDNRKVK